MLQRFARTARETAVPDEERCEFCSELIPPQHVHLLEVESRDILCACRACSILFDRQEASLGKYRRIGERRLSLPEFKLDDVQWASLRLPVDMVFFFFSTPAARVMAYYPSPMGPTESLLKLQTWAEIVANNPLLQDMEQDVEALLINRARGARHTFLVPIDDCYRLVGLLRQQWRGFSGGPEVWQAIDAFFAQLAAQAEIVEV
ncbi:MAG: hypothetical protein IPM53_10745 [Anaerolineaceae bacterium]|nr:hypothetical protein [Anaerolineaceae bacterium]